MIRVKRSQFEKFASFANISEIYIKSHTEIDGITKFSYVFPVLIDQGLIGQLDGDLQFRVFKSQKRSPSIAVKKSDIAGTNIFKKIDKQRIDQISSRKYEKMYFLRKFLDRPDLALKRINFEAEISDTFIGSDNFSVEIAAVRLDGSSTVVDTIEVNHENILKTYDIPTDGFSITATRDERGKITVSGVAEDPVIKGFIFSYRSDSSPTFRPLVFSNNKTAFLGTGNISTADFDADDSDLSYTIRAIPVSKFFSQKIGNFKEQKLEFIENGKFIPAYVSLLSNESVIFSSFRIDNSIRRVFLFRESLVTGNKEFVDSARNIGNFISLQDSSRIPQYDFRYVFEYQNDQGEMLHSPTEIIVPGLKLDNLAKISAKRTPGQVLTFDVAVEYQTSTVYDDLISDLRSLGLESLYSTDLEKMTNNLKPLTRVIVTRISQETGIEENIGLFQPGRIILSSNREQENPGYIYRFEVAVRSAPETLEMLASGKNVLANNSFNLGSTSDLATKQIGNRYSTSSSFTSKFFTKSSIKNSTIKSGDSLSLSDLSYYSGRTGIFSDVRVDPSKKNIGQISSISKISTNKGNFITWNSTNSQENIDYFIVTIDGEEFKSFPAPDSKQRFFVGNKDPKLIKVVPVFAGEFQKTEQSTSKRTL